MKKLLYAWIEQVLSFDTKEELEVYITKQKCLTQRRQQAQIISNVNPFDIGSFGSCGFRLLTL